MKPLRPDDPRQVGDYRVLRQLGAGGMGQVYVGRSRGGRVVAIKIVRSELADDPAFRVRFRREVDAARRVGGGWTAQVLDADPEADRPWLVTGYVPGPSLYDAVSTRGPLPLPSLRVLGVGLAEALSAVHSAGLVHRDLKPTNVLLALDGPKVIDFGISHAIDATVLTRTGVVIGSPAFMPPEQLEADNVTPASDVFALGAVLAYAATGVGPFGTGSLQTLMFRILTQEPDLDAVPVSLVPVVARCLAKAPADRPTPAQLAAELAPPGGPSALVTDGWLPPDLTNALSRRAVELLELDDDPPGPAALACPTPAGGPAIQGGPPSAAGAGVAAGAGAASRHGRMSASPAAAVAVAVLLLLVGAIAAAVALRGDDSADRAASPPASNVTNMVVSPFPSGPVASHSLDNGFRTAAPNPPSGPDGTAGGADLPAGPGPLPEQYVGTWEGTVSTQSLGLDQNVVLVLRPGGQGDVVGSGTFTISGLEELACRGESTLVGVADGGALLRDVPGSGGDNPEIGGESLCTSGSQYLLEPQPGGDLRLTVYGEDTGNPTGTLRRRA